MSVGTLTVRADGDHAIGHGHLMRSMALADAVTESTGMPVRYATANVSAVKALAEPEPDVIPVAAGSIAASLRELDPADGPVLIDSYAMAEDDLATLRRRGFAVALFDDGCRLPLYDAGIVIDASPAAPTLPYKGSADTRFLLGTAYFPLRRTLRERVPGVGMSRQMSLLVTMGGSDPDDATARIVDALAGDDHGMRVLVVLGPSYRGRVAEGQAERVCIVRNPANYDELLATTDLVVTGAGGSALECAALGRPQLTLVLSGDQWPNGRALANAGACVMLGGLDTFAPELFRAELESLRTAVDRRLELARRGRALVDGLGAVRAAGEIAQLWSRHCTRAG